ncbi:hypothetical protein BDR26DRAFT_873629 [Obelidium mucronatum]|nr:hypothetical protein BDR26DRAFT_873629 [Obelidium mucronatum]
MIDFVEEVLTIADDDSQDQESDLSWLLSYDLASTMNVSINEVLEWLGSDQESNVAFIPFPATRDCIDQTGSQTSSQRISNLENEITAEEDFNACIIKEPSSSSSSSTPTILRSGSKSSTFSQSSTSSVPSIIEDTESIASEEFPTLSINKNIANRQSLLSPKGVIPCEYMASIPNSIKTPKQSSILPLSNLSSRIPQPRKVRATATALEIATTIPTPCRKLPSPPPPPKNKNQEIRITPQKKWTPGVEKSGSRRDLDIAPSADFELLKSSAEGQTTMDGVKKT